MIESNITHQELAIAKEFLEVSARSFPRVLDKVTGVKREVASAMAQSAEITSRVLNDLIEENKTLREKLNSNAKRTSL